MIVGFTDAPYFRDRGAIAYGFGLFSRALTAEAMSGRFHGNGRARGRGIASPSRPRPGWTPASCRWASGRLLGLLMMTRVDGRQISLAHLTVLDTTPPELVSVATAAGFRTIGIRLAATPSVGIPPYDILSDGPVLRETLLRLEDTGVTVLDTEFLRFEPDQPVGRFLEGLGAPAAPGTSSS